jgi:hypothetical protein
MPTSGEKYHLNSLLVEPENEISGKHERNIDYKVNYKLKKFFKIVEKNDEFSQKRVERKNQVMIKVILNMLHHKNG